MMVMKKMKILLSNDDGVGANGLEELFQQLSPIADCVVCAPDRDCSGNGSSLTLDRPLRVRTHDNGFLSINGTPADCVYIAVNSLLSEPPRHVIAGINQGGNLGDDVLYSGTVAAALEGRFMEGCAMAFSLCGKGVNSMKVAGNLARELFLTIDHLNVPKGTVLNINIPDRDLYDTKGLKVTRLGHRERPLPPVKALDPRGNVVYWIAPAGKELDAGEGTDFHAVANGYVSVTPLQYDQTHHATFSLVEEWLKGYL